jgi:hypothetical protein
VDRDALEALPLLLPLRRTFRGLPAVLTAALQDLDGAVWLGRGLAQQPRGGLGGEIVCVRGEDLAAAPDVEVADALLVHRDPAAMQRATQLSDPGEEHGLAHHADAREEHAVRHRRR